MCLVEQRLQKALCNVGLMWKAQDLSIPRKVGQVLLSCFSVQRGSSVHKCGKARPFLLPSALKVGKVPGFVGATSALQPLSFCLKWPWGCPVLCCLCCLRVIPLHKFLLVTQRWLQVASLIQQCYCFATDIAHRPVFVNPDKSWWNESVLADNGNPTQSVRAWSCLLHSCDKRMQHRP